MRKPEEIIKKYNSFIVAATEEEAIRVIRQIQIEAIEETVKKCAENACGLHCTDYVDKQSILQVADKLKKELE